MAFTLIHDGVIEAIQAQLAAEHGGRAGLREKSMLKMLHARARALSESTSTDLASLAACYGYGLAHDQLFLSGNLATALIVIELFLELNQYRLKADDTTCFLGLSVVEHGELSAEAFAGWIRRHIISAAAKAA
ncbi:death-on-curing protein [Asticcacaulis sp. EMRT-3]|uniref:type II toxin-antitoxin system death-on-curing family toxin n=1 Tax=Asticcacaulis sp. EMRT-3 TaxID=3040349 RepID=UPI0024AF0DE9|nr:death-on-curing protein [Asticcacaulis sp. EMRT-3]MDI7776502.1 death-on-curing protein [Asticcacaulis sp. EMRT-3]